MKTKSIVFAAALLGLAAFGWSGAQCRRESRLERIQKSKHAATAQALARKVMEAAIGEKGAFTVRDNAQRGAWTLSFVKFGGFYGEGTAVYRLHAAFMGIFAPDDAEEGAAPGPSVPVRLEFIYESTEESPFLRLKGWRLLGQISEAPPVP